MMMNNLKKIATWGPIGSLPAPGTITSLLSLFFVVIIATFSFYTSLLIGYKESAPYIYCGTVLLIAITQFFIVKKVVPLFVEKDPSEIVADEFVGILFTFLFIPLNYKTILLGFCLFRYFDISKTIGIKYLEKLPGAWGIMLDDVAAGLVACGVLHLFLFYGLA
jgi:phosphatidylglycerophosphatase A